MTAGVAGVAAEAGDSAAGIAAGAAADPAAAWLRRGTVGARALQDAGRAAGVIEIRAQPPQADAHAAAEAAGARPAYWKDLLWQDATRDFADAALLRGRLADLGIDPDGLIAVYGEHRQYGFYARWAMRHAGLPGVVVLEDPQALAHPPAGAAARLAAGSLPALPQPRRAFKQDVLDALADPSVQIVDARSREEYDGYRVSPAGGFDHGAERAGHVPGAIHLHYQDFLDEAGRLRPDDALRAAAGRAGLRPDRPVIAYCRLSHRASLVAFVLQERLGYADVRLYDGSWTEWGSSVGTPIVHHRR